MSVDTKIEEMDLFLEHTFSCMGMVAKVEASDNKAVSNISMQATSFTLSGPLELHEPHFSRKLFSRVASILCCPCFSLRTKTYLKLTDENMRGKVVCKRLGIAVYPQKCKIITHSLTHSLTHWLNFYGS